METKSTQPETHNDPADAETPEELVAQWEAEAPEKAGPTANFISSLVVFGLGIFGMVLSLQLGLGTPAEPDSGTWPFVVSIIATVMSAVQMVVGRRGGEDGEKFSILSWYSLIGFVTLILMVILMPLIGFEVPSLLLCFVWMRWLGGETWRSATIYSLLVVAVFYLLFIVAFGTSIPRLI